MVRIDDANTRDKATLADIQKAMASRNIDRAKYLTGFGAFGFDTNSSEIWNTVRLALGEEGYARAVAAARRPIVLKSPAPSSEGESDEGPEEAELEVPKVRDAILGYLRAQPKGEGAQVPAIKDYLSDTFKMVLHEKTPGMTLYRLSKEHLVRREGRTWFATDVTNENMQTAAPDEAAAA